MNRDWRETTIGDEITLQRGFDITRAHQRPGVVPVVSSSGISSFHDTAMATGPGVVLGRKGVVGSVYYVDIDYWPHDTTLWVKNFRRNLPRFVYYFFRGMVDRLSAMDVGSANPTLNRNHVHPIGVRWPALPQQRAIAAVLGALDDKIEQNRRTARALERLARAIFRAWFVDFEPVKAKAEGATAFPSMPQPVFDALPTRFVDSPIGPVPEGWEVVSLERATSTIETGKRPKGGVKGIDSGVPSIGAESIKRIAEYDFAKTKYVPDAFFETMKKGVVADGDVLLYKDGGRPGDFQPHVSMFGRGFPFERMCINEHVFRIRARAPLTQNYLYLWLSSDGVMAEMRRRGTGVAIPGLSASAAKELRTLVPDEKIIQGFEALAQPLLSLCLSNASESAKLAAMRDYLLPKLLSGQVRVKDTEQAVGRSD